MDDSSLYLQRVLESVGHLEWPAERLASERRACLRELVGYAKQHSSFYAERLAHLDAQLVTEADLASIPPLGKAELMQHWDQIVTTRELTLERCEAHVDGAGRRGERLEGHRVFATGGSTGRRAVAIYGDHEWEIFLLSSRRWLVRSLLRSGTALSANPVVAQIQASTPTHMSGLLAGNMPDITMHALPVTLPLTEIVKGLNELQPEILVGYASALRMLGEEALAGRLQIDPSTVSSGGEPLSEDDRNVIRQAWNVHLFDIYGASEVGILAVGDDDVAGLYLNDDLLLIEPVDADGRPVEPGERSAKLYVTPLHHRTLPLLRYELTDEVTLLREPCPHGSAFRRIARVEGRLDDGFAYPGGIRVHPIVFRSPLTRRSAISAYQVRQTPRGAEISLVSRAGCDDDALAREIEAGLAAVGLSDPRVTIEQVDRIERTRHGAKLRRFVPLA